MSLPHILIFIALAFFPGKWLKGSARQFFLLVLSVLAIYLLQPALPIRGLDFYLPTLTLGLVILSWRLVTPTEQVPWRSQWRTLGILLVVPLLLAATRYLPWPLPLTPSLPPLPLYVLLLLLLLFAVSTGVPRWRHGVIFGIGLLLLFFLLLKTPALTRLLSQGLRWLTAQDMTRAAATDIRWLGFSFIAFRLIHTLRDCQMGRLPGTSLAEYVTYVLFFPALTAGPIDRLERFLQDLRRPFTLQSADVLAAGMRLSLGLLKKFVLADTLALIALNDLNAWELRSSLWSWGVLYAYSWQIYWDFSGYTDIAIGLGRLFGIQLPENFNRPYQMPNLTQFWNNWHMTLTQWFRAYFFNPLTRSLRRKGLAVTWLILVTQLSTMLLIGLWHGVTWNFILWGIWHGVGLFVHNRWSEWVRPRWQIAPRWQPWWNAAGAVLSFHYVTLGWVFFALSSPQAAWRVFSVLFGGAG
ncbi:MAG: MBOAT family O-acyltransferase [Anaerolineales bacterium]